MTRAASRAERDIKADIRLALGRMIYLENTPTGYDQQRKVHYGVRGKADLTGICPLEGYDPPVGRTICIEVKTDTGVQSDDQKRYAAMVKRWGGFYALVRSVDEAMAAVERCKRGERE